MEQVILLLKEIKSMLRVEKEILTMQEFALYSGLSLHQIQRMVDNERISYYSVEKHILFLREDVIEFLLECPHKKNHLKIIAFNHNNLQ